MTTYIVDVFGVEIEAESRDEVQRIKDDIEALREFHGIGHIAAAKLVAAFGSAEDVLDASLEELRTVDGIGEKNANNIFDQIDSEEAAVEQVREDHMPLDEAETVDSVFDQREVQEPPEIP